MDWITFLNNWSRRYHEETRSLNCVGFAEQIRFAESVAIVLAIS